jgi:hypothetical protein
MGIGFMALVFCFHSRLVLRVIQVVAVNKLSSDYLNYRAFLIRLQDNNLRERGFGRPGAYMEKNTRGPVWEEYRISSDRYSHR